jgi:hypothetical protein
MSLAIPCSACGSRRPGEKLTQITWAWYRADGERVAWRQKLCIDEMAALVAPLIVNAAQGTLTCPSCGIDTTEDTDWQWFTAYPAGAGKVSAELPMCAVHAAELRVRAQVGAVKLENRPIESRGQDPGPSIDVAQVWRDLGIIPRDR